MPNTNAEAKAAGKSRRPVMRKIGILGSGANPWQYNHLVIAEQAWQQFGLDWVYLVPAGQPVDKKVVSKKIRWNFTKMVARNNPHFKASRQELDRSGPSYSVDTLRALKRRHKNAELFFIIGEDRASSIAGWHEAAELVKLCTFLVAPRNGCGSVVDKAWLAKVLPAGSKFDVIEVEYSSTFIRKQLAAGKSVRYMLPDDELAMATELAVFGPSAVSSRPSRKVLHRKARSTKRRTARKTKRHPAHKHDCGRCHRCKPY